MDGETKKPRKRAKPRGPYRKREKIVPTLAIPEGYRVGVDPSKLDEEGVQNLVNFVRLIARLEYEQRDKSQDGNDAAPGSRPCPDCLGRD